MTLCNATTAAGLPVLNDVHSALNPTPVQRVERPASLAELQALVRRAAREGTGLAVGGGRHAMGGQQFATRRAYVDTTALRRVLGTDDARGLLRIEAGALWPDIIAATHAMRAPGGLGWGIRQKQTGVDAVTLGGSIAANAHGRGLHMGPLVDDIEDLDLVAPDGELLRCSRQQHPGLFAQVVGGYGLFGIVYAATLRLAPRQRVVRLVDVLDLEDARRAALRRADEGCLYGDFQFVIDADDPSFLRRGVLACYRPVDEADSRAGDPGPAGNSDLPREAWIELLRLAHADKAQAFRRYAQHYLGTHGQRYWSDTMQLATYLPDYAEYVQRAGADGVGAPGGPRESLVIGEHYVPRERIGDFMAQAGALLRGHGSEVIYGTIRAIRRDTTTFLPWAAEDSACVVFNLRTPHTPAGIARSAAAFRGLIDAALALGGRFFLTYHRWATREQVLRGYPAIAAFLEAKQRHDPGGVFVSDWYEHLRAMFDARRPATAP